MVPATHAGMQESHERSAEPTSQNQQDNAVQPMIPTARADLAFPSPINKGTVLRPVILSPSMSRKSWAWEVVVIAPARTRSHLNAFISPERTELFVATSSGPEKKHANPIPLSKFFSNGFDAPFHSLYHRQENASRRHGPAPPVVPAIANMTGYMQYKRSLTWWGVIRPAGRGLQDLLILSSEMADSERWLWRVKRNRLLHDQRNIWGKDKSIWWKGKEAPMPNSDATEAFNTPNKSPRHIISLILSQTNKWAVCAW